MKKIFVFLIFITFNVWSGWSLSYKVSYLTDDNGLSSNIVDNMFQDSHGFIWLCTSKGLNRYDGYEFIHFDSRNPQNPLPSNNVHAIQEDSNGNFWIGTDNGLCFMNYKTGKISNSAEILNTKLNFANHEVFFINKDEQGNLWVGYSKGLVEITIENQNYKAFEILHTSASVVSILFYNGSVLVGVENQIYRLIKNNAGKFDRVNTENNLRHFDGTINVMYFDNGLIWIGTSFGLYKYDPNTEALTRYMGNLNISSQLTSSYITDIARDKDGQLLIGTLIGLNIFDYHTNSFSHITSEPDLYGIALNNNFVNCLLVKDNLIWIGTDKGGVNLLSPNINFFNNIIHQPTNPGSLSKNPVNAIYEDASNDLFVGTVEGGLDIRKNGSNDFMHAYSQMGNPHSLSHNSVSVICQDFRGDFWLGTWGMGINKLKYKDKYKPVFEQFTSNGTKNSLQNNFVAALVSDPINKGLWIGMRDGIDFLNLETGKFRHVLHYLKGDRQIHFITGMYIDSKRRLWVGTNYGLTCIYLNNSDINENKITYQQFQYLLTDTGSHIFEKINCITETKDHQIWFGSNGNGLYSMEDKSGKLIFKNYNERTGLQDNVIYGMIEDETETLWLSTDKGLCAFNALHKSIRNYTKTDGLISNQFYWDAYCKGNDGKMYFGSVSGLTVFDPLKMTTNNQKNSVTVTRIKVLNEDILLSKPKNQTQDLIFTGSQLTGIRLHESDKTFSVEFSALTYSQEDKIKYAYRLKGFDNNWTETASERRFASFTNIKYGNYELEIKCTNADGSWSDQITTLHIKVIPPIYKTWWFLLLLFSSLALGIYRYSVYRINLLKKQQIHLKKLVDQRTHEIELQKETLEDQAIQLQANLKILTEHQEEVSRQNQKLILQNQKITQQKEELIALSEKLEEATVDKISFFTNITHEFRTPITLILGPIERALKLSNNPKVLEQLHIVHRNSKLLLQLINQLMDFRKVDSGKMELLKTQQNFIEFINELILPFEDLVKDRGIAFHKQYRINQPEFLFDSDNLQKLITNLLSNAIKFTPDRGEITVIASTYTDKSDQKERLYVAVKDTGKGVQNEEKEKIFERFYQSKSHAAFSGYGQSGTGIGLYLCKRIVELHNGIIDVHNQSTGGAVFRFIIPIERRISTFVSVDGKPIEMIVANEPLKEDEISEQISKDKPVLLIVEDNSDMRQYIRSILSYEYNVLEAPNGQIGIEITNRYLPDLIISDIMMPEMDGLEMCKRLKNSFTTSHIPIVLLTAKSSTDTQIESFQHGADAYLIKPFNEDLLKAMIQNLNEKRKRVQLNFAESLDAESLNFDDESLDKKFIDKALKVIKDNYENPDFDVAEFIDAMGISRSLLHKKLTNLAGQSASRFIRIYRLNMARELIIKNRSSHALNISEIAYRVGFNDPKYFTRCFTKQFGVQPSTFLDEA